MGQFSWYTCDSELPILDNTSSTVYLLNPFGENIKETYYDGYGRFGGVDVYDKVAEWNKDYLPNLLNQGSNLMAVAEEWIKNGEESANEKAKEIWGENSYMIYEWKRNIGIQIACYDRDNFALPYPIKIAKGNIPYNSASPSMSDPNQGWGSDRGEIREVREEQMVLLDKYYESQEKYFPVSVPQDLTQFKSAFKINDDDVLFESDTLSFGFEVWNDDAYRLIFPEFDTLSDDEWVNFYVAIGKDGEMTAMYFVDSNDNSREVTYSLKENEKEMFKEIIEDFCQKEEGKSYKDCFEPEEEYDDLGLEELE